MQGWVHFGMLASARAIFDSVSETVTGFLEENPEWGLMCTGHSLGGGVAALFCTMYGSPAHPATHACPELCNSCMSAAQLPSSFDLGHV